MAKRYDAMTKAELLERAKAKGIRGRSRMTKAELIDALRKKSGGKSAAGTSQKKKEPLSRRTGTKRKGSEKGISKTVKAGAKAETRPSKHGKKQKQGSNTKAKDTNKVLQEAHPQVAGIPEYYGDGKLVLLARDPYSLFCYWDLSDQGWQEAGRPGTILVLKFLDTDGSGRDLSFEVPRKRASSYYVHIAWPSTPYRAVLAAVRNGRKRELLISNAVSTPPESPSDRVCTVIRRFRGFEAWSFASPGLERWDDLLAGFENMYVEAGGESPYLGTRSTDSEVKRSVASKHAEVSAPLGVTGIRAGKTAGRPSSPLGSSWSRAVGNRDDGGKDE